MYECVSVCVSVFVWGGRWNYYAIERGKKGNLFLPYLTFSRSPCVVYLSAGNSCRPTRGVFNALSVALQLQESELRAVPSTAHSWLFCPHIHTCFVLFYTVFILYFSAAIVDGSVSAHRHHGISASTVDCNKYFTHQHGCQLCEINPVSQNITWNFTRVPVSAYKINFLHITSK